MGMTMNQDLKEYKYLRPIDFITVDHQDYAEDRLIEACERLEETGIETFKIASGLIFALHNLLYKLDKETAKHHYSSLLREVENNIHALDEIYGGCEKSS